MFHFIATVSAVLFIWFVLLYLAWCILNRAWRLRLFNDLDENDLANTDNELSKPKFEGAYEEVKKFIKACSNENIDVVASVVEGYKGRHINLEKCERTAKELGAKFRVREWIQNGY